MGIAFGCALTSVVALLLTQLLHTNASFHHLRLSKRIIECLLVATVLAGTPFVVLRRSILRSYLFLSALVILALMTLALFLGFERLQTITSYGFSFWSFVAGTCCIFISCVIAAVYRIDVEFEFRRYRHESIATLC